MLNYENIKEKSNKNNNSNNNNNNNNHNILLTLPIGCDNVLRGRERKRGCGFFCVYVYVCVLAILAVPIVTEK